VFRHTTHDDRPPREIKIGVYRRHTYVYIVGEEQGHSEQERERERDDITDMISLVEVSQRKRKKEKRTTTKGDRESL
jgi:hypothetical protein